MWLLVFLQGFLWLQFLIAKSARVRFLIRVRKFMFLPTCTIAKLLWAFGTWKRFFFCVYSFMAFHCTLLPEFFGTIMANIGFFTSVNSFVFFQPGVVPNFLKTILAGIWFFPIMNQLVSSKGANLSKTFFNVNLLI